MKTFSIAKSRRLRSTPYTSRIEKQGVTAYSIYNHMLLPAAFGSVEDSYHHLKKNVQVWDVAGERQVEIIGNDAAELVQLMTCSCLLYTSPSPRDLSTSRIEKQGVTAYSIYNHMLLPAAFGSIEDSYHHLKKNVQVWDLSLIHI